MLALDKVGKIYPNGVNALARFSAEIAPGEIVAIIGGSGCGKSTLLRAIAGLDRATSGTVSLDATAISAPHEKIGIIFQEPRLLPWLSVADNIGFGLSDLSAHERREKVARSLARVGLSDKANAWPRELSGGQAQRVAIARALVQEPDIILADEPIASLDPRNTRIVMDALLRINKHFGITVICNLHSLDLARTYCDRLIGMSAGRIVFDGAPVSLTDLIARELYDLEANDVMGSAPPVPADVTVPELGTAAAA